MNMMKMNLVVVCRMGYVERDWKQDEVGELLKHFNSPKVIKVQNLGHQNGEGVIDGT